MQIEDCEVYAQWRHCIATNGPLDSLIIATAGYIAFNSVMIVPFSWGAGKHQWNVSIADLSRILRYVNLVQVLYNPAMFFAKFCLLLQVQRIFCIAQRNFTFWAIQILIIANALIYTSVLFAFVFACSPREAIWNPNIKGKCMSSGPAMVATSGINLASDIAILVLPIIGVSKLQMPLSRKLGVSAVFAVGLLAIAACIARLVYTIHLIQTHDITYWVAATGLWTLAEFCTVILCACFPTFPRLFQWAVGKGPRGSKYSYDTNPRSKPTIRDEANSPYIWGGPTNMKTKVSSSPYIAMDERTVMGASNSEGALNNSQSSLWLEEARNYIAVQRTFDVESMRQGQSTHGSAPTSPR
jgi:hypothetical protein